MAPSPSPQQPLQSLQINNQNNNGLIGNGSNNLVNSGNITIEINDPGDELDRLLGCLVSKDALRNSFYSPPECHPNTRATVRNQIGDWIDEAESVKSPLLWLHGPAAVGKSVIAKTISGFHDQIVATFFFSTSSNKSAATLFPTLAWQLAGRIPDTRKHIIASLKNSGSLQTSQIEEQFDLLIIQPLRRMTLRSRPVMVIDGVDECTDEDMLVRFLRVLVQAGKAGDMPVRFVICSRPEPRIHAILGRVHGVNPTTNGQEPTTMVYKLSKPCASILAVVLMLGIASMVGIALFAVLVFRFGRKGSWSGALIVIPFIVLLAFLSLPLLLAILALFVSSRSALDTPIQRSRGILQGVWQLYQPMRLGADRGAASSETYNELPDMLDKICPHSVISTIQIGFSKECKQDIARYLTDKFNEISQPGESTTPWFQQSDISDLVEASCGQFLYASTVARLLDEPRLDPRDVLEMARRSSLPTPDLNKLYKAILKRAQDTIRDQAKEGGPNCQKELRLLTDSLAMLVFFAGNDHFFAIPRKFPVIETLLGLENGKLTLKLSKLHSVLRIVPGEIIQVHHRSFLEFLQNRERSREYYIGYSEGSRRILVLMTQAGLRYHTVHFRRRFE